MIRTITFALIAFFSTPAFAQEVEKDPCAELTFPDLVAKCREQEAQASLAQAVDGVVGVVETVEKRLARLEAAKPAPTPTVVAPPSAPAPAPVQQQVAHVPQGPAFGQPIPVGVAIGGMPSSVGASRPGIHIPGFIGAHREPISQDWMVCASDAGVPIGVAFGVPIGVSQWGQVITKVCAPAGAQLNVFNLGSGQVVTFELYRPSSSHYGMFERVKSLACPGSASGFLTRTASSCWIRS